MSLDAAAPLSNNRLTFLVCQLAGMISLTGMRSNLTTKEPQKISSVGVRLPHSTPRLGQEKEKTT
jgi:hypothetical protein